MENTVAKISICPKCGKPYRGYPALSRADNATLICPDCGTKEALETLGIDEDEQKSILRSIHRCEEEHP